MYDESLCLLRPVDGFLAACLDSEQGSVGPWADGLMTLSDGTLNRVGS